ncbi:peptidase S8/S53 domain-containing protein [Xylariales sp. AK1849]|nr:peptidase S8/S53 domain-containing protein [Xylariales sp. AK1849]
MRLRQLAILGLLLVSRASTDGPDRSDIEAITKRDVPVTHGLHERQEPHWASRWVKRRKIPGQTILPVRIGLAQSNLTVGERRLREISDPGSRNYGRHLSTDEVIEMFAPTTVAVEAVKDWLVGAGCTAEVSLSPNRQWIQFDAEARWVEELLFADFFEYEHRFSGIKTIAVKEYHVPRNLSHHVDYITPSIRLRASPNNVTGLRKRTKGATNTGFIADSVDATGGPPALNSRACDTYLTTACIRSQYYIQKNSISAIPGNELGIFEGSDQHYSKKDLDTFFANLYPSIPQGTYPEERLIDGAIGSVEDVPNYNQSDAGTEANLDIEAAWPLIWPQRTVLFQADDEYYEVNQTSAETPYLGYWNTFFDAIDGSYCTDSSDGETGDCTTADCLDPIYPNPDGYEGQLQCGIYRPTNVISISYSGGEADLPASYIRRQCHEIMKLSLQGVTVVESSGDYGVASYPGDAGMENGCAGPDGTIFYPAADVTCPYVLAVGATQLNHVSPNSTDYYESALSYSGGGFSNYFDAPLWQENAVSNYFSELNGTLGFAGYDNPGVNFTDAGSGVYRTKGRAYPDVSAVGEHYEIFSAGKWGRASGTSLSAPIWAAVLTLVNERRLAANKSTVGLVHPVLYAHPEVFNDITKGSNPGCNSTGFPAAKGWDPISGLGTPNFPKLINLFLSL